MITALIVLFSLLTTLTIISFLYYINIVRPVEKEMKQRVEDFDEITIDDLID